MTEGEAERLAKSSARVQFIAGAGGCLFLIIMSGVVLAASKPWQQIGTGGWAGAALVIGVSVGLTLLVLRGIKDGGEAFPPYLEVPDIECPNAAQFFHARARDAFAATYGWWTLAVGVASGLVLFIAASRLGGWL